MPTSARISTTLAALFGLGFLLAAIWFPENFWRLIVSSIVMFVVALVLAAVGQNAGSEK